MKSELVPQLKKAISPIANHSPRTVGSPSPIGATVVQDGVNFCLFSRTATGVELLLFAHADDS